MKKLVLITIFLISGLLFASGNREQDGTIPTSSTRPASTASQADTPLWTSADGQTKVLIAYFTWADNTIVEHPEEVDVDASTSASVLHPGNTERLASWIQEITGGDVFPITTVEKYPSDYDECLDIAATEKAENTRPSLSNHVEDISQYDVIFLGFPNWWYTLPMAIHSFVESHDLTGKIIAPFCAHGTSGLSGTIRDLTRALPDSTILDPFGVYRPNVAGAQDDISTWVHNLTYAL
ncbi:MAG: flavodoxin [Sphaerochaetaceae bacterium]